MNEQPDLGPAMSEVTLELVQAKQDELLALIKELQQRSRASTLRIPPAEITLQPGEWYAGAMLNEDGSVKHHTIVAAVHEGSLDYDATQEWAQELGLSAPTRQESRLIVAHKYGRLAKLSHFWTCEPHENKAYAWGCDLGSGNVFYSYRSNVLGGVAVRRISPSVGDFTKTFRKGKR